MTTPYFDAIEDFADIGVRAFASTRALGTLSTSADEAACVVSSRWDRVRAELSPTVTRLATSRQVHGAHVLNHSAGWSGWLRADSADGHFSAHRDTALGISVADCVPILIAHPSGIVGALHAGWRGIAAGILTRGLQQFFTAGARPADIRIHLGPAICGNCYEVGSEVYHAVSGRSVEGRNRIDLRAELAARAVEAGISRLSISGYCTRCNNDKFFSHRAGDAGRQFMFIVADSS